MILKTLIALIAPLVIVCLLCLVSYFYSLDDNFEEVNNTNNDIMWDCFESILLGRPKNVRVKVYSFIYSYYQHKGEEVEYNFSIDNWQVVMSWLKVFDDAWIKRVPIFGRHTKHPIKMVELLWMKYPILAPLKFYTLLDMAVRHLIIRRKTASGQHHTSGLLLDYYVFYSYESKFLMWALTKMMGTMFSSWEAVFNVYHGNPTHYNYKVYRAFLERGTP